MKIKLKLVAVLCALLFSNPASAEQADGLSAAQGFDLAVDAKGNIRVPSVDYRRDWVALGTWSVANEDKDGEGAKGFHMVYTQPAAVDAFRKNGSFPDGTILIKELFGTSTNNMTTGLVSRAAATQGFFVMVKDTKDRFPKNKLWGDGWGWAYFDAKDTKVSPTKDYKGECLECHVPAKQNDWVYLEGYPVLKK